MTNAASAAAATRDAGRQAVLATVDWLIDAPVGDIAAACDLGRSEAREMKYFAQRLSVLQRLAEKRGAAV